MSKQIIPGFTEPLNRIMMGFPGYGYGIIAEGAFVPDDATVGYEEGCLFFKRGGAAGSQLYINEGSQASCAFKAIAAQGSVVGLAVAGVAAGYKIARGQQTTIAASDTVVTGLATVVSVTASLDSAPTVGCSWASASIGDQAGTPAAGSILVQTWKPTTAGAAGNPDVIAATTFTKKVNWIAIGAALNWLAILMT